MSSTTAGTVTLTPHELSTNTVVKTPDASTTAPVIEIRQFRREDNDDVLTLFRDGMMFYTEPSHYQHCVWLDYIKNSLATDLADIEGFYVQRAGCNFFTATVTNATTGEQEVVGSIAIDRKSGDLAELRRVSVKAEYRRYGIGKLLMNHATEWARTEHGYSRLTLSTAATQHLAIKFYETLGYAFTRTSVLCSDPYFELTHFEKQIA